MSALRGLLRLVAIVVYALRGQRLVPPMVTGDKALAPDVPPSADALADRLKALVLAAACGALAVWVARL